MALNVGDVYYRITANTSALTEATSKVRTFGRTLSEAAAQAKKLSTIQVKVTVDARGLASVKTQLQSLGKASRTINVDTNAAGLTKATRDLVTFRKELTAAAVQAQKLAANLSKSYSALSGTIAATGKASAAASSGSVGALQRQARAAQTATLQYNALRSAANRIGVNTGSLTNSFNAYIRAMTNGQLSALEFSKAQGRLGQTMGNLRLKIRETGQDIGDSVKQIKSLGTATRQIENLQARVTSLGGGKAFNLLPPNLAGVITQSNAALVTYTNAVTAAKGNTLAMAKAEEELKTKINGMSNVLNQHANGLRGATGAMGKFIEGIKSVGTAFAAFLIFSTISKAVTGFISAFGEVATINARLQLNAKTTEDLNRSWNDLYGIAQKTRTPIEALVVLYSRLQFGAKNLGLTQAKINTIVSGFAAGLAVSGAQASESRGAILQFAQALGSGKLAGDEFRSVLENNTAYAKALADQLAGGSIKELYRMKTAGEITAQSISKVADAINNQLLTALEKAAVTPSQALTQLNNAFLNMIRNINAAFGVANAFVSVIKTITENIGILAIAVGMLAGAGLGSLIGRLVASGALMRTLGVAVKLLTLDFMALSVAEAIAGNIFVVIGALVAGAIAAYVAFADVTVRLGGETFQLSDIVQASWSVIKDAINAAMFPLKGWWLLLGLVKDAWVALSGVAKNAGVNLGESLIAGLPGGAALIAMLELLKGKMIEAKIAREGMSAANQKAKDLEKMTEEAGEASKHLNSVVDSMRQQAETANMSGVATMEYRLTIGDLKKELDKMVDSEGKASKSALEMAESLRSAAYVIQTSGLAEEFAKTRMEIEKLSGHKSTSISMSFDIDHKKQIDQIRIMREGAESLTGMLKDSQLAIANTLEKELNRERGLVLTKDSTVAAAKETKKYNNELQNLLKSLTIENQGFGKSEADKLKQRVLTGDLKDAYKALGGQAKVTMEELLAQMEVKRVNDSTKLIADGIADIDIQLAKLAGHSKEAAMLEFAKAHAKVLQELADHPDDKGAAEWAEKIAKLREQTELQENLNEVTQKYARIQEESNLVSQKIENMRHKGAIGELESLRMKDELTKKNLENAKAEYDAYKNLGGSTDEYKQHLAALGLEVEKLKGQTDELGQKFTDIFTGEFADALASVVDGTKSIKDAFKDMANAIIQQINRIVAQEIATKIFGQGGPMGNAGNAMGNTLGGGGGSGGGGWGSMLANIVGSYFGGSEAIASSMGSNAAADWLTTVNMPAMASGGPVSAGRPYWIGEDGPEVMVPKTAGTVVPTHAIGGDVYHQNVHVTVMAPEGRIPRQSDMQIRHAISSALAQASRHNG